jgi:hypothetical protein
MVLMFTIKDTVTEVLCIPGLSYVTGLMFTACQK